MNELHIFFVDLWNEREENGYIQCFETGRVMKRSRYRENWSVYSHILPKSKYPQYKFEKWNVKIVTPDAHTQYEVAPERAKKQYALRLELLEKIKKGEI